ncbi:MAG TPA: hypothetical protein PK696_00590, partial [bacterium]|nr:hypothetical protein [bacterium]
PGPVAGAAASAASEAAWQDILPHVAGPTPRMIIDTAKDTLPVRINAPSLCPASPATPRAGAARYF